jgi:hypothetical protein
MIFRLLADIVLLTHFAFVLFVVLGGLLVLKWPRTAWLHLPAAAWGVIVQLSGLRCPLTPLEWRLRELGGEAGYTGGFVEHYIFGLLYPAGLTSGMQTALGLAVAALTAFVYIPLLVRIVACRQSDHYEVAGVSASTLPSPEKLPPA